MTQQQSLSSLSPSLSSTSSFGTKIKKVYIFYYFITVFGFIIILLMYNNIVTTSYVRTTIITTKPISPTSMMMLTTTTGLLSQLENEKLNEYIQYISIIEDHIGTVNKMIQYVQGDDERIVRWDATDYTKEKQNTDGCSNELLQYVLNLLQQPQSQQSSSSSRSSSSSSSSSTTFPLPPSPQQLFDNDDEDNGDNNNEITTTMSYYYDTYYTLLGKSVQYLTFCITDHPIHRQTISRAKNIQRDMVQHLRTLHYHQTMDQQKQMMMIRTTTPTTILSKSKSKNAILLFHPLLDSTSYASAMICHFIYISCFNNVRNHNEFYRNDIIPILSNIIQGTIRTNRMDDTTNNDDKENDDNENSESSDMDSNRAFVTPIQVMWASAALQNIAASYCSSPDGRCRWDYPTTTKTTNDANKNKNNKNKKSRQLEITTTLVDGNLNYHQREEEEQRKLGETAITNAGTEEELMILDTRYLPLSVDASMVRQYIYDNDLDLIDTLVKYSCSGPVETIPLPGEYSTKINKDELSYHLVAWATTGALKNLAISKNVRSYMNQYHYPNSMMCFCLLSHSIDWLERNKGNGILFMLRRSDPCWFQNPKIEYGEQFTSKNMIVDLKDNENEGGMVQPSTTIDTTTSGGGIGSSSSSSSLCIDHNYYHVQHKYKTCSDYDIDQMDFEQDCAVRDTTYNVVAKEACCACGGGTYY